MRKSGKCKTELRIVLSCLLFIGFIASCGNSNSQLQEAPLNDSIPADIRAINEKINSDRNNADLYFQRAKSNFAYKNFVKGQYLSLPGYAVL